MQSAHADALHHRLDQASASWDGRTLVVDTGAIRRTWSLGPRGLATTAFGPSDAGTPVAGTPRCDWTLPGGLPQDDAEVVDAVIDESDDEGFTSTHLRIRLDLRHAAAGLDLRMEVWAYPGVPGLRTALAVRARSSFTPTPASLPVGIEAIPTQGGRLRAIGYFNDTQHRNTPETPLIRDEVLSGDVACDWASICACERDGLGVALVKESQHCADSPAHDGGGFRTDETSLRSSGWGLLAREITADWRQAWAHWALAYEADDPEALPRCLRRFIAARWPVDIARDTYVMSNTWGSTEGSRDARDAAREDNVLRELAIAQAIGVDVVQIDDGWQVDLAAHTWNPEEGHGWKPHPAVYPQGWTVVRERAHALGLRLGLWAAGMPITGAELQQNRAEGGFTHYKLDFMRLTDHERIAAFRDKVRTFVRDSGHRVRINFDVTERQPRVGYLWLREAGSLYLANRKPHRPESTIYRPHLMLRDAWHLARWQRLQQVQITVQNPRRTDRRESDAWQHSTAYCLATALMATPILFQQLQFLAEDQRAEIRDLLAVYRQHREAIHLGDVEPIGDEPDGTGLPGFHCRCADGTGYLLVFRERLHEKNDCSWTVPGLGDQACVDCCRGDTHALRAGRLDLDLEPASFCFLRYG